MVASSSEVVAEASESGCCLTLLHLEPDDVFCTGDPDADLLGGDLPRSQSIAAGDAITGPIEVARAVQCYDP